ncbi:MAG TPA: ECF transporter S component [Bacteroidales bacterium]|nr:ECF transporter S component [Bacteroidales bacterium]
MTLSTPFIQLNLSVKELKTWIFTTLFIVGNLLLPQLCHFVPNGGLMLLPIYFFTLIAAYKFGLKVGLLTAVFSPLVNSLLFGMPIVAMLPIILTKSVLLAVVASLVARRSKSVSVLLLALVVLGYQVLGGVVEGLLAQNLMAGVQDFRIGFPGLMIQVLGGWMVLKALANYER